MDYPNERYTEIIATIEDDLAANVLAIVQQHIGRANRISRRDLVAQAFGVDMGGLDLSNSTFDRQVRLVMAELQVRYPILSSSGAGGYFYASSAAEIGVYAGELESRAKKMFSKSRQLLKLAKRFQADVQLRFVEE